MWLQSCQRPVHGREWQAAEDVVSRVLWQGDAALQSGARIPVQAPQRQKRPSPGTDLEGGMWVQQSTPKTLKELLKETDATGRQKIIQQLSINLIPIMEKGLLDPVIVHG